MKSTVFEDNNSALGLATSSSTTPRTRHITVKYHFFVEHVGEVKRIMIHMLESKYQNSDVFTKVLPSESLQYIMKLLMVWWL